MIEDKEIKQVYESKSPGVTIDQHLSWNQNTEKICKKIVSGISARRQARDFITKDTLVSIYNALVQSHFTIAVKFGTFWERQNPSGYKRRLVLLHT